MLNNLALGKKIGLGFTITLSLIVIVGAAGYYSLENASKATSFYRDINTIERVFTQAKEDIAIYLINSYADGRSIQQDAYNRATKSLLKCKELIDAKQGKISDDGLKLVASKSSENITKYIENYKQLNSSEQIKMELASDMVLTKDEMKKILDAELFLADEMVAASSVLFAQSSSYIQRSTKDGYQIVEKASIHQNKSILDWTKKVESSQELNDIGKKMEQHSIKFKELLSSYHDEEVRGDTLLKQMESQQSDLYKNLSELGTLTIEQMSRVEKAAKITIVVFIAVSLVMGVFLSFVIAKAIVKPVLKMAHGLCDIAQGEGDLTMRIEIAGKDEVAKLAGWFNLFIQKLQDMIRDIASNASVLKQSSMEMSNLSKSMSKASDDMAKGLNSVAASTEEMSSNMNSVAASSEEASVSICIVTTSMAEMKSTINEIAKNANSAKDITSKAVSVSNTTSINIGKMKNIAVEISKVTDVITEISEQTNLLALNATIEAARAGESGKGFAVVANEIKELARHTADATSQIRKQIETVQGSTELMFNGISEVVNVVGDIDNIVSSIAAAVEEQSSITAEIAQNIEQASKGIADVNENISQSSVVASDIAKEISSVNQLGGDIAKSSVIINQNAAELSELSQKLQNMVNRFKV
ncbi:MAG: methyl-accepting chemotaxis protein [Desulfamplus sp.]|nr:methyl-accepting chemotaxis protein [Desulfamplus sp.]